MQTGEIWVLGLGSETILGGSDNDMRRIRRLAAAGAAVSVTLVLGACAERAQGPSGTGATTPAETTQAAPTTSPGTGPSAGSGVTQISDIYGPACNQVPTQGEGSAQGMVDDAVATAASNNPLLSTLVDAVKKANLVDTLNSSGASYTVFAPANTAFQSLPPGTLQKLLSNQDQLKQVLTYHVVPQRYDAAGLAQAGQVRTVAGVPLTITGEPGSLKIDQQSQASVLCGNIPTANATVFVIDKVLLPPGMTP